MFIDNWFIREGKDFKQPKDCKRLVVQGNIYGHPCYIQGAFIKSNPVKGYNHGLLECFNGTKFKLGDIHREYKKTCPNAESQIIQKFSRK